MKCSVDASHKATVICVPCRKYLCKTCDSKAHDASTVAAVKSHVRYPISMSSCF